MKEIILLMQQYWFTPLTNLLTVAILAITAWEGFKTSRATSDSNKLKLLPLLGLYFYHQRNGGDSFKIKNLGQGVAYDIRIDPWILILQDIHEIIEFKMKISGTNILPKDEEKEVTTEVYENSKKSNLDKGVALAIMRGLHTSGILIEFKDSTGKNCACKISISNNDVNILKPAYRTNFMSNFIVRNYQIFIVNVKIALEQFLWKHESKTIGIVPKYPTRIFNVVLQQYSHLNKDKDKKQPIAE